MLATKLLRFRHGGLNLCRGYLSSEFKAAIALPDTEQLAPKTGTNFLEILRDAETWIVARPLTSHIVVKSGIENSMEELLTVLQDRLEQRIFLDNYTGCYVMNMLAENGNHAGAMQVAVDFQEEFTDELASTIALKAIYDYLKDPNLCDGLINPPQDTEKPEKKERVKFLRNTPVFEGGTLSRENVGKAILNLAHISSDPTVQANMIALGLLLTQRHDEALSYFKAESGKLHRDILELCLSFIKAVEGTQQLQDLLNRLLDHTAAGTTFVAKLEENLKSVAAKRESSIIELQKQNYEKWIAESKAIQEQNKKPNVSPLAVNAKQIVDDLEAKKELLWYFENRDKIDLKIFQQKKLYPKRWFGKKKTPRAVHDNYVPPEVTRRA